MDKIKIYHPEWLLKNRNRFFKKIPNYLLPWFPDDKHMWFILGRIAKVIKEIHEANQDIYDQINENVYADKSVTIAKYTEILGPALIGKRCIIRHGAFIRGNVIIGDNCIIGNSTEIKNSVLFNDIEIPHFNYVGDSILGNYVHFGAGAITSNVLLIKNKREKLLELQKKAKEGEHINEPELTEVKIKMPDGNWIRTGYKKFGAIIGDYAEIGVNTTINPGTLLEMNTFVPSAASIGGYFKTGYTFPRNIIYGSD